MEIKKILAVLSAVSALGTCAVMPVQAGNALTASVSQAESSFVLAAAAETENANGTDLPGNIVRVAIDQKQLTVSQLEAIAYKVPVFVRLVENPGITSAEFGLQINDSCTLEVINSPATALHNAGESLDYIVKYGTDWGSNTTRLAWASSSAKTTAGNLAMLYATVPSDAQAGDKYHIRYLETMTDTLGKDRVHLWCNAGLADYVAAGKVEWTDGYIEITDGSAIRQGDANGDGDIDILDVITMNRAILGVETLTDTQINAIDFNGNSKPDSEESLTLMKYIVGLISDLTA